MRAGTSGSIMLVMTLPPYSRFVLVSDPRAPMASSSPGVRRYRLARIALNGRRGRGRERFVHLKRTYD